MRKVESCVVYRAVLPDSIIESESLKYVYLSVLRELKSYIHWNKKEGEFLLQMTDINYGLSFSIETRPGYFEGGFIRADYIGTVAVGVTKSGRVIVNYMRGE